MKILVIQQKMIGDVLTSTIICESIKRIHPEWEIHYMIQPGTVPVVENSPFIDTFVLFKPEKGKGLGSLIKKGKELKNERYDAVIDAYGKWEAIIPAYLSRAAIRIGFKKWYTRFFYTKVIERTKNTVSSAIHHRIQLAEALLEEQLPAIMPKIFLTPGEIEQARKKIDGKMDQNTPILMISALGSDNTKSLPPKQMAELIDFIAQRMDVQMIFNYMPHQREQAQEIFSLCRPDTQGKVIFDFEIKGLRDFLSVLYHCDALIGNEGGAVNMAKALNIPTFTVFCPWINKNAWNMLTDTQEHVAVHLEDFFPELYKNIIHKKLRKKSDFLYEKLKLSLYSDQLENYLEQLKTKLKEINYLKR